VGGRNNLTLTKEDRSSGETELRGGGGKGLSLRWKRWTFRGGSPTQLAKRNRCIVAGGGEFKEIPAVAQRSNGRMDWGEVERVQ